MQNNVNVRLSQMKIARITYTSQLIDKRSVLWENKPPGTHNVISIKRESEDNRRKEHKKNKIKQCSKNITAR